MFTFSQMLIHIGAAVILGAVMGIERELVGKEAGLRTTLMVASGAALFTIIGLELPYIISLSPQNLTEVLARNGGFLIVIANIVMGVGFLGAGTIIKNGQHVHGLTTASVVWVAAAIGMLCGLGMIKFAAVVAIGLSGILYILRKAGIQDQLDAEREG